MGLVLLVVWPLPDIVLIGRRVCDKGYQHGAAAYELQSILLVSQNDNGSFIKSLGIAHVRPN